MKPIALYDCSLNLTRVSVIPVIQQMVKSSLNHVDRRVFQDVVPIQMLAGCTSGISSALIG